MDQDALACGRCHLAVELPASLVRHTCPVDDRSAWQLAYVPIAGQVYEVEREPTGRWKCAGCAREFGNPYGLESHVESCQAAGLAAVASVLSWRLMEEPRIVEATGPARQRDAEVVSSGLDAPRPAETLLPVHPDLPDAIDHLPRHRGERSSAHVDPVAVADDIARPPVAGDGGVLDEITRASSTSTTPVGDVAEGGGGVLVDERVVPGGPSRDCGSSANFGFGFTTDTLQLGASSHPPSTPPSHSFPRFLPMSTINPCPPPASPSSPDSTRSFFSPPPAALDPTFAAGRQADWPPASQGSHGLSASDKGKQRAFDAVSVPPGQLKPDADKERSPSPADAPMMRLASIGFAPCHPAPRAPSASSLHPPALQPPPKLFSAASSHAPVYKAAAGVPVCSGINGTGSCYALRPLVAADFDGARTGTVVKTCTFCRAKRASYGNKSRPSERKEPKPKPKPPAQQGSGSFVSPPLPKIKLRIARRRCYRCDPQYEDGCTDEDRACLACAQKVRREREAQQAATLAVQTFPRTDLEPDASESGSSSTDSSQASSVEPDGLELREQLPQVDVPAAHKAGRNNAPSRASDDGEDDADNVDADVYPQGPVALRESLSFGDMLALADVFAHDPHSVDPSSLRLAKDAPPPAAPRRPEAYTRPMRTSSLMGAGHAVLVYNHSPAKRAREEEEEPDDEEVARRKKPSLWRRFTSLFGR